MARSKGMEYMRSINQVPKNKTDLISTSMKVSFLKTIKTGLECNGATIAYSSGNLSTTPIFLMQRRSSFITTVIYTLALSSTTSVMEEEFFFNPSPKVTNITSIRPLRDILNMRI
jgi:hypothetical protein